MENRKPFNEIALSDVITAKMCETSVQVWLVGQTEKGKTWPENEVKAVMRLISEVLIPRAILRTTGIVGADVDDGTISDLRARGSEQDVKLADDILKDLPANRRKVVGKVAGVITSKLGLEYLEFRSSTNRDVLEGRSSGEIQKKFGGASAFTFESEANPKGSGNVN